MKNNVNQLEHVNINVKNIDETLRFLTTALPNFHIRGGERLDNNKWKWVHIGTNSTYLCLNENDSGSPSPEGSGFNHAGFIVDDIASIKERLEQVGYKEGFLSKSHPHRKRVYYIDGNGTEWEFIEYSSEDPHERNDYKQKILMNKEYLAKGLNALSRSMEKDLWAGHWGAAVIAAYYFSRDNDIKMSTHELIKKQINQLIKAHKDYFTEIPVGTQNNEFEEEIISAFKENAGNLCAIGHNVIYTSLALKASRDVPEFRTSNICDGIIKLIHAFNNCDPGHFWVDGKTEIIEPDNTDTNVSGIDDARSAKKYVLDSFINAERSYREESGDMQLGHLITHGQSIVELFELGYPDLAQEALKPFAQRINLIEDLRKRIPCNDLSAGVGNFISPLEDAYWEKDYSDSEWVHGHIFKYPYSFYDIINTLGDSKTIEKATDKFRYLIT